MDSPIKIDIHNVTVNVNAGVEKPVVPEVPVLEEAPKHSAKIIVSVNEDGNYDFQYDRNSEPGPLAAILFELATGNLVDAQVGIIKNHTPELGEEVGKYLDYLYGLMDKGGNILQNNHDDEEVAMPSNSLGPMNPASAANQVEDEEMN